VPSMLQASRGASSSSGGPGRGALGVCGGRGLHADAVWCTCDVLHLEMQVRAIRCEHTCMSWVMNACANVPAVVAAVVLQPLPYSNVCHERCAALTSFASPTSSLYSLTKLWSCPLACLSQGGLISLNTC
jgi:hypothetical protein